MANICRVELDHAKPQVHPFDLVCVSHKYSSQERVHMCRLYVEMMLFLIDNTCAGKVAEGKVTNNQLTGICSSSISLTT